jgi:hypothetical protein
LSAPADVDQPGEVTFALGDRGVLRRLAGLGRRGGAGTAAAASCRDEREGDDGNVYQAHLELHSFYTVFLY